MRWVWLTILTYVVLLLQTTLAGALAISTPVGMVNFDLLAMVAVFVVMHVRDTVDALLAAWGLGLALDLTASGAASGTVVGAMPVGYVLAAAIICRMREAFFRQHALSQAILTLLFCIIAHGVWVAAQSLMSAGGVGKGSFGSIILQVLAVALYTAVLAPVAHMGMKRLRRGLLVSPGSHVRSRRK